MHGTFATGRLTRDPEIIDARVKVAKFSLAVDDYDFSKKERMTVFYNCVGFGKTAERIEAIPKKGMNVTVFGKMRANKWESDDGVKHERWELIVDDISFNERKADAAPTARRDDAPVDFF